MSVKSSIAAGLKKVWTLIKGEPVAVWGVVLAAVLGVLPAFGVSAAAISAIGAILAILGVPVVRGKVTPLAALEAIIAGLKAEIDSLHNEVKALKNQAIA